MNLKAVSLFSGGLDSQLAVQLIKEQNIKVIGVHFTSPFFEGYDAALQAADKLGIDLNRINVGQEYIDTVLKNPVYGYGRNFNPCIDCHAFMLNKAGRYMQEIDASFLISGEVVGQRPMSQNKSSLNAVDKLSGFRGLIVRPLSAKLLPISIPESEGWIDRDRLLNISGRGRKQQIELAKKYSIQDYPTPAGGCLLTEAGFARRLRKVMELNPNTESENLDILKTGRHFYLDSNLLVVGRNHTENLKLQQATLKKDSLFKVLDYPGPLGLLRSNGNPELETLKKAAAVVARYSDARMEQICRVKIYRSDERIVNILEIKPLTPEETPRSI